MSPTKTNVILTELHDGPTRGHYGMNITIKKIFTTGYWWPIVQRDVAKLCQSCNIYQQLTHMYRSGKGPL